MRRTISDDASLSTDIKSDISFVRRQKELRNLYRDFRSALDNVQSVSTSKLNSGNIEEEEEEETLENYDDNNSIISSESYEEEDANENNLNISKKSQAGKKSVPNDIDLIIQDIEMLQSETKEIVDLLNKSQIAKNPRVKTIKAQLQYVKHIVEGLKERAYGLKTKQLTQ